MSRKSFRAHTATAALALLAAWCLLVPPPAAADPVRSGPTPLDSLAQLVGMVQDLWNGMVSRLTEAPQSPDPTPGRGGVDVGSADPIEEGGDRGGTIDPNGGVGEG